MKTKTKTKSTRGGPRANSGRKPLTDKKEAVNIYIPASQIKKVGGKEKLKKLIPTLIVEYINSL